MLNNRLQAAGIEQAASAHAHMCKRYLSKAFLCCECWGTRSQKTENQNNCLQALVPESKVTTAHAHMCKRSFLLLGRAAHPIKPAAYSAAFAWRRARKQMYSCWTIPDTFTFYTNQCIFMTFCQEVWSFQVPVKVFNNHTQCMKRYFKVALLCQKIY